ncbi:MAG: hypothetical protein FJ090_10540 [Deltaproteobacteria bacterium]|nr:hypothetical protein [Deltaproteobacteria bacterium]
MDATATELADLLAEVEAAPSSGAARLRAAVIANRLAQASADPWMADVAEAIAEEDVPGATRALRDSLHEQADLSQRLRRAMASGHRVDEISPGQDEAALAAGA